MKYYIALAILLLTITTYSCKGPLRLMHKQELQAIQQQQYHNSDTVSLQRSNIAWTRSGETGIMETELTPAGMFRYSPDSGFTGTATTIKMRRQYYRSGQHRDSSSSRLSGSNATAVTAQSSMSASGKERLVRMPAWRSYLPAVILILVAAAVVWWFVKGKRRVTS